MSTITADANMLSVLSQAKCITEIRDASGNLMGIYAPGSMVDEKDLYEQANQLFDPVELERRKRDEAGKGSPLEEVWKRIHAAESKT